VLTLVPFRVYERRPCRSTLTNDGIAGKKEKDPWKSLVGGEQENLAKGIEEGRLEEKSGKTFRGTNFALETHPHKPCFPPK